MLSTQLPIFKENLNKILNDGLNSALYNAMYQSIYKESSDSNMGAHNSAVKENIKAAAQEFAETAAQEFADNVSDAIADEIDTYIKSAVFSGTITLTGTVVSPAGTCTGTILIDTATKDTINLL